MSLNYKIQTYLLQNNIAFASGDYATGQPEGQVDQVLFWSFDKLGVQPTQTQLDEAWAIKVSADNAIAHRGKRAAEYPPIFDYVDGIVKGDQLQVQAYVDACLAIKVKYPKTG